MLKRCLVIVVLLLCAQYGHPQKVRLLNSGSGASLRGLCAVSDRVIWVSGSSGSVGLSTDSGISWKWMQVSEYKQTDFRDIEAFSDREAIILGVTRPAVILRTIDGGLNWQVVFQDSADGVFLDAMDFYGDSAIAIGDPVNRKWYNLISGDKGKTWTSGPNRRDYTPCDGEAFFAASGTNVIWTKREKLFVTGGAKSGLIAEDGYHPLRINQGRETTGANSIAVNPGDPNFFYVVGGDFSHDTARYRNSLKIRLHPFMQTAPVTAPHGYRSCVEYLDERQMICCGISGVDYSGDGGLHWRLISVEGFHVCRKSKTGKMIFFAGPGKAIGILQLPGTN